MIFDRFDYRFAPLETFPTGRWTLTLDCDITQEKTATNPETKTAGIKKKKVNIKCDICDK